MASSMNRAEANKVIVSSGTQGAGDLDPRAKAYIEGLHDETRHQLFKELKKEITLKASQHAEKIKEKLQSDISQNQTRVIEALAIFVALFTFVSVNIQIFNKVTNLHSAVTFMILMAFVSMIMMSLPLILLRSNSKSAVPAWTWIVFVIAIILFLVSFNLSAYFNYPLTPVK